MAKNNTFLKITIGFILIIIIFIFSSLYTNIELNYINKKLSLLNQGYISFIKNLSKIETTLHSDQKIIEKISSDKKLKASFKLFIVNRYNNHPIDKVFHKSLAEIDHVLNKNPFYDGKKFYNFAKIELSILENYYKKNVSSCMQYIHDFDSKESCQDSISQMLSRVKYLNRVSDKKLSELSINIESVLEKITIYNSIFMSLSGFIVLVILIFSFILISPIKKLINAISFIKKGDYSHRVNMKTGGEIGQLVDSFNDMILTLQNRDEQIKEQQHSIKTHHDNEIKIKNKLLEVERLAAIGKISAQIAHEIRNPLNSINLNTDIIGDEIFSQAFDPEEIHPLFDNIKVEIQRLNDITQKYLRLAKEPDLHIETGDIVKLLNNVMDLMDIEFKNKNITLQKKYKATSQLLQFDNNIMKSSLINILKNSLEATSENGLVSVDLYTKERDEKRFFVISIKDTGIGISDKDKDNIFNPFFTTKKYGTGIGLFTVKEAILNHNGLLEFKSEFSKGTEFFIYLPLDVS